MNSSLFPKYQVLSILIKILNKQDKLSFLGVMFWNVLSAVFEVFSIGLVIPVIGILISPEKLFEYALIQELAKTLGILTADQLIRPVIISFVCFAVIATIIRILAIHITAHYSHNLGSKLSLRVFENIISRDYTSYKKINSSEDLSKLIPKVNTVIQSLLYPLINLISAIVMFTFIITVFLIINFKISVSILLGLIVIYVFVTLSFRRRLRENSGALSELQNNQIRIAQESISGIKDVILNESRDFFVSSYKDIDMDLRKRQAANIFIAQAPRYIVETLSIIFIILLALYFVYFSKTISNELVLPVMATVAVGLQRILPIVQQAYRSWANIEGNKQSLFDVLELLETHLSIEDKNCSASNNSELIFEEQIELRNICYSHRSDSTLDINNLNLIIRKGEKIGLIGGTGSGKSTLIDIIMGLITPDTGDVLIDGRKINSTSSPLWYRHISHVPQHVYILDSDFYRNIAFGALNQSLDKTRAEWAAKLACADQFIQKRQQGYHDKVGERGGKLSGGQIQRLGIARCLYKKAQMIVMDEATSALDTETENQVMQNIYQLGSDYTFIFIAHQISTLDGCDKIIEMDNGCIKRIGSFEEIIEVSAIAPSRI